LVEIMLIGRGEFSSCEGRANNMIWVIAVDLY